ncbi:MAG: methyltransferase type 11, partial [Cytophagaceae bacterium]
MTRYPTPRIRPASPRPVSLITNQVALFGQPGLLPPTRTKPQLTTNNETKVATGLPHEQSPVQKLFRFCTDTACIPVGNAAKLRANLAAIDTLKAVQQQNRPATPHEQQLLAQYTGWGGLSAIWKADEYKVWQDSQTDAAVFVDESVRRWGSQYGRTRQRLADLLTPTEQTAAEA